MAFYVGYHCDPAIRQAKVGDKATKLSLFFVTKNAMIGTDWLPIAQSTLDLAPVIKPPPVH